MGEHRLLITVKLLFRAGRVLLQSRSSTAAYPYGEGLQFTVDAGLQ